MFFKKNFQEIFNPLRSNRFRLLQRFHSLATKAGLAALVEVHDEGELDRALAVGAKLVGVNNRDLKTFKVDSATTERLAARLVEGRKANVVSRAGRKGSLPSTLNGQLCSLPKAASARGRTWSGSGAAVRPRFSWGEFDALRRHPLPGARAAWLALNQPCDRPACVWCAHAGFG